VIEFNKETRKYILRSKDGKRKLGEFDTRGQAVEREKEILAIINKDRKVKLSDRKSF